jgi:hypothetical protein
VVSTTVVDGDRWRREIRVRKGSYSHTDRIISADFRVKDRSSTAGAETKHKLASLVPDPREFRCRAEDFEGGDEARQRREDAACPSLACKAMANADTARFAGHFDSQLPASAASSPRDHDLRVTVQECCRYCPISCSFGARHYGTLEQWNRAWHGSS